MIKTYRAKKTMDFLPAGEGKSVISMVKGIEFNYDDSLISTDIPSEFYEETDTWKFLVIPATASGVAFSVEKEWVMNPFVDPVRELASFCVGISCRSKAPVAITNFKIEIWTYNDNNSTALKSTWVQQINALGTTNVLNGASTTSQSIYIHDIAVATRVKIKISGTPNSNIVADTNFQIYPNFYENMSFDRIGSNEQTVGYSGLGEYTHLFKGLYRTKTIPTAIVKETDIDITLDVVGRRDSAELSNYKFTEKFLLVRTGTTASIKALALGEKFEIKTEGYGNTDGGIQINKNTGGSVIEAIVNYLGQITFTINVATTGWHYLVVPDKTDNNRFLNNVVSFYVNPA